MVGFFVVSSITVSLPFIGGEASVFSMGTLFVVEVVVLKQNPRVFLQSLRMNPLKLYLKLVAVVKHRKETSTQTSGHLVKIMLTNLCFHK